MTPSQFAPQFLTSPQSPTVPQWRGPLFVAGTGRSGTSLLYVLLNKHPQIRLMYEGDLFLLRPLFWIPKPGSRWLARWEFWNGALKRHGLDTERIPLTLTHLPAAMEKAYQEYARQKGALIWGDKSIASHHSLPRLVRDFPDARFIFLWRDLTAICRSVIRATQDEPSFPGPGMMRTIGRYKALKAQCDHLVSRGVPVHQIHYETLVKDPAGVMADVCKFLDVPFVPAIASLEGADRSAIYEGAHHALVRSECIVSSLERSEAVSADLQRKIERYITMWREESGGEWPLLSFPQTGDSGKPSLREQLFDRVVYCWLRTYDSMALFTSCFVPSHFLSKLRIYKNRFLHRNPPGAFWLR